MRICILQSAYPKNHALCDFDGGADPSRYTDQHTFEHCWIQKDTAKEQIDAAVAKHFDFYFNFMWGQHEDEVAGIEACQYFESFRLPAIGLRSEVLQRNKKSFIQNARALGAPRVPGSARYPLFVKPASSCASQFISEKSLCQTQDELLASLKNLNEALEPGRKTAGHSIEAKSTVVDGIPIPDDIVVQQYVSGWDYSVVVIEVGDCPVPLAPEKYVYPEGFAPYDDFLRFDVKFHADTGIELLSQEENKELFCTLQAVAVQAWHANQMAGQSWCNVDIRVPIDGEPTVIEVNPMPAVFLPSHDPSHDEFEDLAVRNCFPGGHRALVNVLIASHLTWRQDSRQAAVASTYDGFSKSYDELIASTSRLPEIYNGIAAENDFSGSCLELGSGTGLFGRLLGQWQQSTPPLSPSREARADSKLTKSSLTGIEISKGMIECCGQTGVYDQVYEGSIQKILPSLGPFDHIISVGTLYFLTPEEFSLVMARSFQLARKTIAVTIDEIPEQYNARLIERSAAHMAGYNHVEEMDKTFANPTPAGWKLAHRSRHYGWSSPTAQTDVNVTVYVFKREGM